MIELFNWYLRIVVQDGVEQIEISGDISIINLRHDAFVTDKLRNASHVSIVKADDLFRISKNITSTRWMIFKRFLCRRESDDIVVDVRPPPRDVPSIIKNNLDAVKNYRATRYKLCNIDSWFYNDITRRKKQQRLFYDITPANEPCDSANHPPSR